MNYNQIMSQQYKITKSLKTKMQYILKITIKYTYIPNIYYHHSIQFLVNFYNWKIYFF